jgi:ribosomal protein S18 acetylase RimI-like enzyme
MANIEEDIALQSLYCLRDETNILIAAASAGAFRELDEDNIPWLHTLLYPCELARIGVLPAKQVTGVASALLQLIIEDTRRRGFNGMRMLVSVNNPRALALYDRAGFGNCGKLRKYDIDFYCYELLFTIFRQD